MRLEQAYRIVMVWEQGFIGYVLMQEALMMPLERAHMGSEQDIVGHVVHTHAVTRCC